jgi:hypothetical protein
LIGSSSRTGNHKIANIRQGAHAKPDDLGVADHGTAKLDIETD